MIGTRRNRVRRRKISIVPQNESNLPNVRNDTHYTHVIFSMYSELKASYDTPTITTTTIEKKSTKTKIHRMNKKKNCRQNDSDGQNNCCIRGVGGIAANGLAVRGRDQRTSDQMKCYTKTQSLSESDRENIKPIEQFICGLVLHDTDSSLHSLPLRPMALSACVCLRDIRLVITH